MSSSAPPKRSGEYDSASVRALHAELDNMLRPPVKRLPLRQLAKTTAAQLFDLGCTELEKRGWNESQIARALQVTPQYVQDLRAGRRNIQAWVLLALPPHGRAVVSRGLLDGVDYSECQDPPSWISRVG